MVQNSKGEAMKKKDKIKQRIIQEYLDKLKNRNNVIVPSKVKKKGKRKGSDSKFLIIKLGELT